MATTKKAATTATPEAKEKKARKPREKKVKVAVLRQHPKYPEFLQALSVDGWMLIEPIGNWQAKVPLLHPSIGETVKLLLGEDGPIKVVSSIDLPSFKWVTESTEPAMNPDDYGTRTPTKTERLDTITAMDVSMDSFQGSIDDDFADDDFGDDDINP